MQVLRWVDHAGDVPVDEAGRKRRLAAALAGHGFLLVRHAALEQGLVDRAQAQARRLFALEPAKKRALTNGSTGTQPRGHTVFGARRALAGHPGELREAWHVGPSAGPPGIEPNLWPQELPELRAAAQALFAALEVVGEWVLRCCERAPCSESCRRLIPSRRPA